PAMLKPGDKAPDFKAQASDGRTVQLSDLRGRPVILYFFPKAFTPGCTVETQGFRDNYEGIKALGAEVIGVSTDDIDTQSKFADKHNVGFPLIGAPTKQISKDYGVLWPLLAVHKRVTFVIDENGVIGAVLRHELQISRHVEEVKRFLEEHRARN